MDTQQIKDHMPETYKAIQGKAGKIGGMAYKLVRQVCAQSIQRTVNNITRPTGHPPIRFFQLHIHCGAKRSRKSASGSVAHKSAIQSEGGV